MLVQGNVVVVCPYRIVDLLKQTCGRDRARTVVNLDNRVYTVLSQELQGCEVEAVRILLLVYIEVLGKGVRQLGIALANVAVQLLAEGHYAWPVLGKIVGCSHSVALGNCWSHCAAERNNLTWRRLLGTRLGRHGSFLGGSCKLVLKHTLARVGDVERSAGCRSLRRIHRHAEGGLVELNLRTFVGCCLLNGRHCRRLAPTVVGYDSKVVLGRSLQALKLIRHGVARELELGVNRYRVELVEVVGCREWLFAIIYNMVVDALLLTLRYNPLDKSVVVRRSYGEVGNGRRHSALLALQCLVSIDKARTHLANIVGVEGIKVVYGCGKQCAERLVREVLVAILGKDKSGDARNVRTSH